MYHKEDQSIPYNTSLLCHSINVYSSLGLIQLGIYGSHGFEVDIRICKICCQFDRLVIKQTETLQLHPRRDRLSFQYIITNNNFPHAKEITNKIHRLVPGNI